MRSKLFFCTIMLLLSSTLLYAQKYVKYFFDGNQVRILVEKSLEKITDDSEKRALFETDVPYLLFMKKKANVQFQVRRHLTENLSLKECLDEIERDLAGKDYAVLKAREKRMISKKEVWTFEYMSEDLYYLQFLTTFNKDLYYGFMFVCPKDRYQKWQPIALEMMRSLEIKQY